MALDPVTMARLGLAVKKYWKYIIPLILAFMLLPFIVPVTIISAILPLPEPEFVKEYKSISEQSNIDWINLMVIDSLKYDNDFSDVSKQDIINTALDFYSINYKVYKITEECILKDNDTEKCLKTEKRYKLINNRTIEGSKEIKRFLGYDDSFNRDFDDIINDIKRRSNSQYEDKDIDIYIHIKTIDEILKNFDKEKRELAYELLKDGELKALYD